MLLVYQEIKDLIFGDIFEKPLVENCLVENINASSLDVRLSNDWLFERSEDKQYSDDAEKISIIFNGIERLFYKKKINKYFLDSLEPVLSSTIEKFNLPDNISAEVCMRSSAARVFINHLAAGHIDPGFHNSNITLELINYSKNSVVLEKGMSVCQVKFFRHEHVGEKYSYRNTGRYNNSEGAVVSKGI